jgi:DnaJ like chaperone protein
VDGKIDAKEQAILEKAARYLGFHKQAFLHLLAMYEAEMRFRQSGNRQQQKQSHYSTTQSLEDAYRILGVKRSDNMTTVKKAYKKLMMEHHPDKLIAKGLPKQAMEMAKAKTQDIQAAYELIKQQHA